MERSFHYLALILLTLICARNTHGFRLECSSVPRSNSANPGVCAHFQRDDIDSPQSPEYHLLDNSKIVFSFRLNGCDESDTDKTNSSNALRGYPESSFGLYENDRLLYKSQTAELAYTVKHQRDYLFNFITILIDMSQSVATSTEYLGELKTAIRKLVSSLVPPSDAVESHKLKLQVVAFAGGADRGTVNRLLLSYRCAHELDREIDDLLATLPHPSELFTDFKSTALNLAVSSAISGLVSTVESFNAQFVAGTLIVFTDGDDTAGTYNDEALFSELESVPSSISIFAIGLGNVTDAKLGRIGKDAFVRVSDPSKLQEGFEKVSQNLLSVTQNRYVVEYCSPKRKGEHVLLIQLLNQTAGSACSFFFDASEFEPSCDLGLVQPELQNFGCFSESYEYRSSASVRLPHIAISALSTIFAFGLWAVL
ncbi:hypothetical protein BSKO_06122 [Bryopsis sp. KO-2023]|nr:hypothetical protein BSKO_06122 [Bryopsis sp. KO-2023]